MKLSNQAMGALMMALQKCLMEETDIIELLGDMDFQVTGPSQSELIITNPPIVSLDGVTMDNVADFAEHAIQNPEEESDTESL
jgi:hypothetical protein